MTTSAERAKRTSNELNAFSTKPMSLQSITESYILLIYDFHKTSVTRDLFDITSTGTC